MKESTSKSALAKGETLAAFIGRYIGPKSERLAKRIKAARARQRDDAGRFAPGENGGNGNP
jgi:hypothetical protein